MQSALIYKMISRVYDLLDVLYFRKAVTSPRTAVNQFLCDQRLEILDVCTGTAVNAIGIAEKNSKANITGIDISKDMLKIAEKKVRKTGLPNIRLCEMDATDTSFENEAFDIVLISLVLHEISRNLAEKMIKEAKRVLKKNGRIIVVEWEKPRGTFQRIMFYPIQKMEPKGFEKFLNLDMNGFFKTCGLQIVHTRHCNYTKVIELDIV